MNRIQWTTRERKLLHSLSYTHMLPTARTIRNNKGRRERERVLLCVKELYEEREKNFINAGEQLIYISSTCPSTLNGERNKANEKKIRCESVNKTNWEREDKVELCNNRGRFRINGGIGRGRDADESHFSIFSPKIFTLLLMSSNESCTK